MQTKNSKINYLKGTSETWVEVMRKNNLRFTSLGFRKKKSLSLIPAAAFEVVSLYPHDNESVRAIHWCFSKTL